MVKFLNPEDVGRISVVDRARYKWGEEILQRQEKLLYDVVNEGKYDDWRSFENWPEVQEVRKDHHRRGCKGTREGSGGTVGKEKVDKE